MTRSEAPAPDATIAVVDLRMPKGLVTLTRYFGLKLIERLRREPALRFGVGVVAPGITRSEGVERVDQVEAAVLKYRRLVAALGGQPALVPEVDWDLKRTLERDVISGRMV